MKKSKVGENVDYDAMFRDEMIRRLGKMGFKMESSVEVGNGKIRLNFKKE